MKVLSNLSTCCTFGKRLAGKSAYWSVNARKFSESHQNYSSRFVQPSSPYQGEILKEQRRFQSVNLKIAKLEQIDVTGYDTIDVELKDGIRTITLNRQNKKNAISLQMYNEWIHALQMAKDDPETVVTAITGSGDFYCAGNDLANLMILTDENSKEQMRHLIKHFIEVHYSFPKPLFAVVNGPAIGISVTTLGLFDGVYASEKATFCTPFSKLQQGPEACSSFTFPLMMGLTNASQMLVLDQPISADTAAKWNLVTQVFPHDQLRTEVEQMFRKFANLPPDTLATSKACIRSQFNKSFERGMEIEMTNLKQKMKEINLQDTYAQFKTRKNNT